MRRSVLLLACVAFVGAAVACSAAAKKNGDDGSFLPSGDGNGDPPLPPPRNPDINNDDAGAFGLGDRGKDGGGSVDSGGGRGGQDSGGGTIDSGGNVPPVDAGDQDAVATVDAGNTPLDACPGGLAAGDLAVVELMIASQTGAGDKGEWIEVQSTRSCSLNLNGLHFESPRGSLTDTLDITEDFWLKPNGIFVVANSSDVSINHNVPAPPLWTWAGNAADVLKNDGDTVTISKGAVTIDSFTYPALVLYSGRSISFPADCAWSDRSSFARWSYSANYWSGTFQGTPNTDNTDVACY